MGKNPGITKADDGGNSNVMLAPGITTRAVWVGNPFFANLMHDRLNEIVILVHQIVDAVEIAGLLDGVQTYIPEKSTHQGTVFLLYEAIVVGSVRFTTGTLQSRIMLFQEA